MPHNCCMPTMLPATVMRRALLQQHGRKSRLLLSFSKSTHFARTSVSCYSSTSVQLENSDLPYHIVVGMPALSPTMEMGTLAEWNVGEGESFVAGDSLAKIETDKATIDFEAQDDGHVAKLLVEAGTPDVAVGVPIMVTVEEEEDVAAFANYEAPAVEAAVEEEEESAVAAAPKEEAAAAPPPPPPTPEPVVAAAAPEPVVAPPTPTPPAEPVAVATMSPAWGQMAKMSSPIAKTLAAQQKAYIEKYGTTGQVPL